MKIKQLAKKLVASVSCLTVATAISISAFAMSGNGTGGGNNGVQTIGDGGFYAADQGFRISIVEQSGKVYGGNVVDVEIAQKQGQSLYDNANNFTYSTGSDPNSSEQEIKSGKPGEYVINAPKPIEWVGSTFVGNGDAVKSHMLQEDENGVQNIKKYAIDFLGLDNATIEKINSGELRLELEPVYNIPIYNSTGNYTGERVVGTVRDFIKDYVRNEPRGAYSQIMPMLRASVEAMILESDETGMNLKALSKEELERYIDEFIYNGNLDELGVGMHIFDLSNTLTPSQPQPPIQTNPSSFEITESRITRRYNLADPNLTNLASHNFEWKIEAFSIVNCIGCHHSSKQITDNDNTINIEQSKDNKELEGVIDRWTFVTDGNNATTTKFVRDWSARTEGADTYSFSGVGYNIVVIRKDDTIDLINYRLKGNEGAIDSASNIVVNTDNTASRGRKANGSYSFTVDLEFEPDEGKWGYEKETKYEHKDYTDNTPFPTLTNPHPRHTHTPNTRKETKETEFDMGSKLEMSLQINWYVYGGLANSTTCDTTSSGLTQHKQDNKMETWLEIPMSNGTTSFHPYIQMQFDTATSSKLPVYVAGQYLRSIAPNEYVGVKFDLSENNNKKVVNSAGATGAVKGKISLSSNQWSTHTTAANKVGNSDCVLPGGATLDMAVLKDGRQSFTIEALTPILAGDGLKQVTQSGGSSGLPSQYIGTVQNNYVDFAKQVIESLEALNVQQYVSDVVTDTSKLRNITSDVWSMSGAKAVSPGANTDEKYYFRPDADKNASTKENANMGDLDVKIGDLSDYTDIEQAIKDQTDVVYYTFFTNTKGELRVKKTTDIGSLSASATISNPDSDGTLVLSQGQDSSAISNTEIKMINNKTHIVDKLLKALESNTGSDGDAGWVGNGHWYNEAFDGITIAKSTTKLQLGFLKPFGRTSVIDPRLTPSSSSKSDLLTKYVFSQLKLRDYCENQGSDNPGKLAEYKDNKFSTQNLDTIYKSDIFYIPNATVQDLR